VFEGILVGIIDASLLRKAMQSCSGVDRREISVLAQHHDAACVNTQTKRCLRVTGRFDLNHDLLHVSLAAPPARIDSRREE
jgi:hypothetical protein